MATASFLFADLVGSTRLWDKHPEAMRAALAEHDEISEKVVDAAGGSVFKHTGDGFIAVFDSAADAIEAATEYQRRMHNTTFADVGGLSARIGVHTGEVEERDGDYFGPAVNRAARLMSAGHGGQVLVSMVSRRIAGDSPGVSFKDLGEHRLRDLSQPERVFQVLAAGLVSDFPPLITADAVPNNLPTQVSSFVGRDQEMEEVAKLLRGARVVTITGVGGAGKTRLALQVAADMATEFPGGVWLVELAAVTDPELVVNFVARTLGVAEVPGRDLDELIIEFLESRRALLILDNCEHVIGAAASLTSKLTSATPEVKVIGTSRELLGVSGEVAFGLRSLAAPSATVSDAAEIAHFDSVRLFLERAAAARPEFRMSPADAADVAEICRRLDGMPLALELAAARLRSFSPRQIADNLDQRFRLLTGGSRTALPRQQTLAAAIDWSYRLLEDQERLLFERLSVFQGGLSLESAMQVCSDESVDEFSVLELLPLLVDKSLLVAETEGEESRYFLLETIRQFAREKLDESGAGDVFRRKHAEHFLELAKEAGRNIRGPDEVMWWDRITLELDNLKQAMTWSLEAGEPVLALAIAGSFWRYWWFTSSWSEGLVWLIRCVKAVHGDAPKEVLMPGLLGWGTLMGWVPNAEGDAIELLTRSLELCRELDAEGADPEILKRTYAASLINLAALTEATEGRSEKLRDLNEEALEVSRRLDDGSGVAVSLGNLAEWAASVGDKEEARRRYAEAVEASKSLRSQQRLVEQYWQVGVSELMFHDISRARQAFENAAQAARSGQLPYPALHTQTFLALCDFDERLEGSEAALKESIRALLAAPESEWNADAIGLARLAGIELFLRIGQPAVAARILGNYDHAQGGVDRLFFDARIARMRDELEAELGERMASYHDEGRAWTFADLKAQFED